MRSGSRQALVDQWMASYEREPASVILDIDDTCDVVHGHQQLSLFNAHYDERCFLPIHVYDTERSRPVAVVLRSARPRRVSRCAPICAASCAISANVRTRTRITFRATATMPGPGDGMVQGQPHRLRLLAARFEPLAKKIDEAADAVRTERALSNKPVVRGYAETRHKAKSWSREQRAVARIQAIRSGSTPVSSSPTSNTARRNGFTNRKIAVE